MLPSPRKSSSSACSPRCSTISATCAGAPTGGTAGRSLGGGRTLPMFASGDELVQKTPGFYLGASKRLDLQLARSYEFAGRHFGGPNLYLQEIQKNIRYAQQITQASVAKALR